MCFARKWLKRYEKTGPAGLLEHSSRPLQTRSTIDEDLAQRIEQLRRARMPMRRIAIFVGRSVATISGLLAHMGLSSLKALEPREPVLRYKKHAPGELLHMDTKKLGRIVRPGHRVTGASRDSVVSAGWEFAHVAIDDHCRAGFVQMHADERKGSAVDFLKTALAHYVALGVKIERPQFPGVNHKRVYRLYRQANLAVRRRKKSKRPTNERVPLQLAQTVNVVWSMDFVSDSLSGGRRLKYLTVADDLSHESLGILVDFGISGQYVTRAPDRAALFRGYPQAVRTDNVLNAKDVPTNGNSITHRSGGADRWMTKSNEQNQRRGSAA